MHSDRGSGSQQISQHKFTASIHNSEEGGWAANGLPNEVSWGERCRE